MSWGNGVPVSPGNFLGAGEGKRLLSAEMGFFLWFVCFCF